MIEALAALLLPLELAAESDLGLASREWKGAEQLRKQSRLRMCENHPFIFLFFGGANSYRGAVESSRNSP